MGPWGRQKAFDRLEDRLRSVELKCADLELSKKSLDLEFTELYDKVRHQMSRMAKRDARANKETELVVTDDINTSPTDGLDPISKSIMLRRGGYRPST